MVFELRNAAYSKIGRLPMKYLDMSQTGYVQSMLISDCETVGDGMILFLNQFVSGIVSIVFTLGIMLFISWRIALFVLIFTPVSFIVSYLIAQGSFKSFKKQADIRSRQTSFLSEMTTNFRECYSYGITGNKCTEFDELNRQFRKTSTKAVFLSSVSNPTTRFVNALIYAGVVFTGAASCIAGGLTVGALSSLLAYANQFMKPFNDLSSVYTELSDSVACLDRIVDFLDSAEEEQDIDEPVQEDSDLSSGNVSIEFRDVSFSYVPGKPVLKHISFTVNPNETFAIVGPTGCGKTTLINVLMRFYDLDSGDILINGISIRRMSRNRLRHYIGIVTQDTWFEDGRIIDNLKFGRPEAADDVAVAGAVRTGADSFIRRLPSKYMENLDSDREDISEGQKQLLSITRAIVSDPSVMILDEATSSVDLVTEIKISKAVRELLNGRTGIIIAHRLSTIVDCDKIVVLKDGAVSEIGSHGELIQKGGFYSKLYESYTC
jgi:ATP-binding cassette subfamily B protein